MNTSLYNIKKAALCMLLTLPLGGVGGGLLHAEDIKGKVVGSDGKPIADVVISSPGSKSVRSDANGEFSIDAKESKSLTFRHDGFYVRTEHLADNANYVTVHLISDKATRYNESVVLPDGTVSNDASQTASNVTRKDFALGSMSVENAMRSGLTGLQITQKSGMTGEGAYIQLHGIKSLLGHSEPLYVINGIPYLPDTQESQIIGGYSRSVFQALNGQDIKNITVLKGGAASAIYGSMAGNGVVLIETDQASKENMNTRISFNAIYGVNWNNRSIPLLNATQYKSYLTDMGLTYYDNQEKFFNDFTFLSDPTANNADLYQYNTDWQKEILRNSTTKDFLFRVEGGDAIAKYNISLGYMGDDGTLKNTNTDRYSAQINASVLVSRKIEIQAAINTAYLTGNYQEQGLSYETNPLLAAYRRSPLLSPYRSDLYGKLISSYSTYQYGALTNSDFYVSNPTAVVNTVQAKQKQYDLNAKVQLIYRPTNYLTLNGIVGMYYNYNQENCFIPGVTDKAIKYLFDQYGQADNTVRVGTNYTFNMYYGANGVFHKTFKEKNDFKATLGLQAEMTSYEYDASFGRNTPNDYYRTMGNVQSLGRHFSGYNDKWNWIDIYGNVSYTYDNLFKVGTTLTVDGASSVAGGMGDMVAYHGYDLTFMLKRLPVFANIDAINKLNVYADHSITGNSRFNSKYYNSYYTSTPYLNIAGIIRANLATTDVLKPEKDSKFNIGIETSLFGNRLMLGAAYYNDKATDVIIPGSTSSLLGTSTYFKNAAEISAEGVELHLNAIPVQMKDFSWTIGGTLSTLKNKVKSLGDVSDLTYSISSPTGGGQEGASLITRVGESPYSFYGYQTKGVYATTADAQKANLVNDKGVKYQAGDVEFVDQNGDGKIDADDRVILGSASPTLFGDFFTRFEYKGFALDANFSYQAGGKAYNAIRRITESSSDFSNQSTAVQRRWSMEGQVTDMPRAEYGDPRGNNAFSDRWIEKTDFLKLRSISLSYTHNKPIWNFIQSATVYVTGENLFTITNYLGLDPEFSYSYSSMLQGVDYGKINSPRSVKFGVNLKF